MVLAVAGAIAVLLSALVPWSRSGAVSRNAFELAQVADDLGEVDGGLARLALFAWFAVPVLVASAWLAATFVRPLLVAAFTGTVALMGLVAGAVVLGSALRTGPGPWLVVPVGAVTLLMVARLVTERRER